jgi:hypothetical protein
MGHQKNHVPLPSCSNGMLAFDGGAFDLSTHEVWAICQSKNCTHGNCHGVLAAEDTTGEYGPAVFRVRNRRDLKKHLSPDGSDLTASTNVLVVPKGTFKGRPSPEQILNGLEVPLPGDPSLVGATGSISVQQARRMEKFPLTPAAAASITELCARPVSPRFDQVAADAVRSRNRNHLETLVTRHGSYHVERALAQQLRPGPDGREPSLGLATDIVTVTLADRNGVGRISRVFARKSEAQGKRTESVIEVMPGPHLAELNPLPGQGVAGRLTAPMVGAYTPHAALRIFDRIYGEINEKDLHDALAGRPLDSAVQETASELKTDLPSLLNDLLSEGVFSSGTKDAPVPDTKKRLVESVNGRGGSRFARPSIYSDQVSVTCPHPFSPNHVVHLLGEVGPATVDRHTGRRSHEFRLRTAMTLARDAQLLDEIASSRSQETIAPVGPHRRNRRPERGGNNPHPGHVYSSVAHMVTLADQHLRGIADGLTYEEETKLVKALGLG